MYYDVKLARVEMEKEETPGFKDDGPLSEHLFIRFYSVNPLHVILPKPLL